MHFMQKKAEAHSDELFCPESHSWWAIELRVQLIHVTPE